MRALTTFHPASSFLRFGAWSVLLHVGAVAMLGALHVTRPMDNPRPLVTVTLLKPPAPVLQDAPPESPPMLHADRPEPPVATQPLAPSPSHQLRLPPQPPIRAADSPHPPTPQAAPPVTRELLLDHHAADTLALKNVMKTPARRTTPTANATAIPQEAQSIVVATSPTTHEWAFRAVPTPALSTALTHAHNAPKVLRDATADRKALRTPARRITQGDTPYPHVAKKRGWEGTVMLRLTISREGTVEQAAIQQSSGFPILDDSALQTVQAWKFEPARDGEFAIPATVKQSIRFTLNHRDLP